MNSKVWAFLLRKGGETTSDLLRIYIANQMKPTSATLTEKEVTKVEELPPVKNGVTYGGSPPVSNTKPNDDSRRVINRSDLDPKTLAYQEDMALGELYLVLTSNF